MTAIPFTWDDTIQSAYYTPVKPRVTEAYQGQGATVPTLDGGAFISYQYHVVSAVNVVQGARQIAFEWGEYAPAGLAAVILATWRNMTQVTVTFVSPLDFTTVDTITGYVPAHLPPELTSVGGRVSHLKVTVQEATV